MKIEIKAPAIKKELYVDFPEERYIDCLLFWECCLMHQELRKSNSASLRRRGITNVDYNEVVRLALYLCMNSKYDKATALNTVILNYERDYEEEIEETIDNDEDDPVVILKNKFYKTSKPCITRPSLEFEIDKKKVVYELTNDQIKNISACYLRNELKEFLDEDLQVISDEAIEKIIKEFLENSSKDIWGIVTEVLEQTRQKQSNKFVFAKINKKVSDELIDTYNCSVRDNLDLAMSCIKKYKLEAKYKERMEGFFTYRIQTNGLAKNIDKYTQAYYNLLVHSEEYSRSSSFIDSVIEALNLPKGSVSYIYEDDLRHYSNETYGKNRFGERVKCLVVEFSAYEEKSNYRIKISHEIPLFKKILGSIAQLAKANPEKIVILSTDEDTFINHFRDYSEIYYRTFGHHIKINAMATKDIYNACIHKAKENSFTVTKEFEKELKNYIDDIYEDADLSNNEFVDDLYNRLASNYFCKVRTGNIMELTPDCIPRYKQIGKSPEDILSELDDLVGLGKVKKQIERIFYRRNSGEESEVANPLHMVFTGNPGTGKTTVAERVAVLLYSMGIIKKKKPYIAKASDLLSTSVNGSRLNTQKVINKAVGGVLFIDEAYSMYNERYETGVVEELVDSLEKHPDDLVVILAGYEKEMKTLLKANSGLKDRFNIFIDFPDYTVDELTEIFARLCKKGGYAIDESAKKAFEAVIEGQKVQLNFSNARAVRNVYNNAIDSWCEEAFNEKQKGTKLEKVLYGKHFGDIIPKQNDVSLNDVIGLEDLKASIESFEKTVAFRKKREALGIENKDESMNYHMLFMGNPGTGKTMIAQVMANILYKVGVLKCNKVTPLERKDLVGQFIGTTEKKTTEKLLEGKGGVIFIDEAYSLATGNKDKEDFGNRVIEQLITFMVDNEEDTVVILAGYENQMESFLDSNPGLRSRFGQTFHFKDYTKKNLVDMFVQKCEKNNFKINKAAIKAASKVIEYFMPMKDFGNGRFVARLFEMTYRKRAMRGMEERCDDFIQDDIPTVKEIMTISSSQRDMYDPSQISKTAKRRTAIHEIGHAVAICASGDVPKSVSVNNQIGSLGRVMPKEREGNMTEEDCINLIATFLSGRNAERVVFGSNATGCSSDYRKAKGLAKEMIDNYAMGEIGVTTEMDFLKQADKKSIEIMTKYKDFIISIEKELAKKGEMTGEEFNNKFKEFKVGSDSKVNGKKSRK